MKMLLNEREVNVKFKFHKIYVIKNLILGSQMCIKMIKIFLIGKTYKICNQYFIFFFSSNQALTRKRKFFRKQKSTNEKE